MQENITNIRLIKAFVREDYESKKFAHAAENLYRLYVKAESLMALNHPVMNMVVYGCIIALSWLGAHYIVEGTLTTGELTSLFSYVMSILMSLMMLSMAFVMLTQSAASAKRVAEVIEEEPDIVNPEHPVMEINDGSIEFQTVRFDYAKPTSDRQHKRSALFNISFSIKSGETIGVIGGTGSGKSTLVNLISRLYDPTRGKICIGGRDVRDYDLTVLRTAVAVVLQQNTLFTGSLAIVLAYSSVMSSGLHSIVISAGVVLSCLMVKCCSMQLNNCKSCSSVNWLGVPPPIYIVPISVCFTFLISLHAAST